MELQLGFGGGPQAVSVVAVMAATLLLPCNALRLQVWRRFCWSKRLAPTSVNREVNHEQNSQRRRIQGSPSPVTKV